MILSRAENEGVKLWIPYNSDYRLNNDWMFENYPRDLRFNSLILTGENVLTAQVLRTMYRKDLFSGAIFNILVLLRGWR